jgi:hypothetical protein
MNNMNFTHCVDCKTRDKCGIKCSAKNRFDCGCACDIKENKLAENLYYCKTCKLLVPATNDAFYTETLGKYEAYAQSNKNRLSSLSEKELGNGQLNNQEAELLVAIREYISCKNDFDNKDMGVLERNLEIDTMNLRQKALKYVEAYNKLNSIVNL